MMTDKAILQHFKPDEYQFIEKATDLMAKALDTYSLQLSEFLDPRQVFILKSIVGQTELNCFVSSDYYPMEYARVIIAPDYYVFDFLDFQISLFEIVYNSKFNQLTHAQIMGSLLHRLGIRRTVIGDIVVEPGRAQLMVDRSMAAYFLTNVTKIAKVTVKLKETSFDNLIHSQQESEETDILVSSMRLDKIIAAVLKISRSQVLKLVEADKVKVNYALAGKSSDLLKTDDLVSVRGFGRFTLVKENGRSKSGKHKLTVTKMIHK
ncbi:RNA-binding protein [Streptococcus pantholopis]|nr:RNA-binding protein [Streptococcus pantholopis]